MGYIYTSGREIEKEMKKINYNSMYGTTNNLHISHNKTDDKYEVHDNDFNTMYYGSLQDCKEYIKESNN